MTATPGLAATTITTGRPPEIVIRPPTGWTAIDLRELWAYRDLLSVLAGRDLKLRYKQTALGVAWVVFYPLIAAGIFSFVFGRVADLEAPGGVPYFLFTFAGLTLWTAFSGTLTKASNSLVGNAHLVSKIYFPRLILPLSIALSVLVDFAVAMGLLTILVVVFWHVPLETLWMFPLCVALALALALGLAFFAAALSVRYRDVQHILPVLVSFLLYASPVAYGVHEVPERWRELYLLNPIAPLLEAFRWSTLGSGAVPWGAFTYAAIASIAIFAIGAFAFRRLERTFADVI